MANRAGQWKLPDPINPSPDWSPRSMKWAWLEFVMPLFALALLLVFFKPEYVPRVFLDNATSPQAWAAWAFLGAAGAGLVFSGPFALFFLLSSPPFLAGGPPLPPSPGCLAARLPLLTGWGGWPDVREVRFYGFCLVILCLLLGLLLWDWRWFVAAFLIVAGFAPALWRLLV